MNVSFRIAKLNDLELLLQLIKEYYAFDGHPFDKQKISSAIRVLIKNSEKGTIWIIEIKESPIGYMVLCIGYSLEYFGVDAFLDEIYIREAYRGKGVGKRAMAFVEGECEKRKIKALHLEVERKNSKAQRFYNSLGFLDTNRRLMTKRLIPK